MRKYLITFIFASCVLTTYAQKIYDKAEADQQVFNSLLEDNGSIDWFPDFSFKEELLRETNEKNIYCIVGNFFQVKSVKSDFYVRKAGEKWYPLFDRRYPVESLVNLLLAHVHENKRQIELRHHQYGNHIAVMTIPMQRIHNLFGPKMEMYCRVSIVGNNELNAWLVFYEREEKYIHLLDLKTPIKSLFDENAIFHGDFYANIPQGNIKSIFDKNNKTKEK